MAPPPEDRSSSSPPPPPSPASSLPPSSPLKKKGGWTAIKFLLAVFNFTVTTVWAGSSNIASLAGAFLADAYLGKFRTLLYGSISSFLGMGVMTLIAAVPQLRPPPCTKTSQNCKEAEGWQLCVLFAALTLLAVGAGGIRPCNIAFGADQFDTRTPKGRSQLECFFNWWYFCFSVSLAVALTAVVYIQTEVSWVVGFAIPTACLIFSISLFLIGHKTYILKSPDGSPFSDMVRVITAAFRKRKIKTRPDSQTHFHDPIDNNHDEEKTGEKTEEKTGEYSAPNNSKLLRTTRMRCLDKAAIIVDPSEIDEQGKAKNPWRLCTLQQVEGLKRLAATFPVWVSGVLCFMPMEQQSAFGVLQAIQIDRSIGKTFRVPPGWMTLTSMVTLATWILTYERLLMPLARRITGESQRLTIAKRIRVGIAMSIAAMVVAANVERKRRESAVRIGEFVSPESFAILMPQFVLLGITEAFAAVAVMEFFTTRMPENMRTLAGAFFFLCLSASNYVNSAVVNVVRKATAGGGRTPWLGGHDLNEHRLDYYYYSLAGLGVLNFVYFHFVASRYVTENDGGGGGGGGGREVEVESGDGGGGDLGAGKIELLNVKAYEGKGGAQFSGDAC
ncbi:unnamed protein product [Linum tenue]|uniref:Uncharacterized protein n=1 Tax=Linum tenue TaxID=586396 RepID=A0AAV0INS1_9ROSI|nr:unnamed protein product [Linum tenue]